MVLKQTPDQRSNGGTNFVCDLVFVPHSYTFREIDAAETLILLSEGTELGLKPWLPGLNYPTGRIDSDTDSNGTLTDPSMVDSGSESEAHHGLAPSKDLIAHRSDENISTHRRQAPDNEFSSDDSDENSSTARRHSHEEDASVPRNFPRSRARLSPSITSADKELGFKRSYNDDVPVHPSTQARTNTSWVPPSSAQSSLTPYKYPPLGPPTKSPPRRKLPSSKLSDAEIGRRVAAHTAANYSKPTPFFGSSAWAEQEKQKERITVPAVWRGEEIDGPYPEWLHKWSTGTLGSSTNKKKKKEEEDEGKPPTMAAPPPSTTRKPRASEGETLTNTWPTFQTEMQILSQQDVSPSPTGHNLRKRKQLEPESSGVTKSLKIDRRAPDVDGTRAYHPETPMFPNLPTLKRQQSPTTKNPQLKPTPAPSPADLKSAAQTPKRAEGGPKTPDTRSKGNGGLVRPLGADEAEKLGFNWPQNIQAGPAERGKRGRGRPRGRSQGRGM
ncbi:MAG: hypothetical protein Q9227_004093 [Pyrenula ochraceoflavens]